MSWWCRLFHWREWVDISNDPGKPRDREVTGTIVECRRCHRRFTVRLLRYARGVTQTPAR